jgi:hypothetical protein
MPSAELIWVKVDRQMLRLNRARAHGYDGFYPEIG